MKSFRVVLTCCLIVGVVLSQGSCSKQPTEVRQDAQVIVVGAGLAGLSAAIEMGRSGVDVLVVDMNSVAGGHTVLAGGVALVATPLQEQLGIEDSADAAVRDWLDWTEDGDEEWSRFYANNSREMIFDWVTEMGVKFVRVVSGHGNSVPRFHFTEGRAVHLVLPLYRTALAMPNISFMWNTRAEELVLEDNRISGVAVENLRSGEARVLRAPNVVLATGGFETDRERVLANWISGLPQPDRLLIGSAVSATGSGHDMATAAGASLDRINRHYIYINGVVDPRDPQQSHALTAGNDHSLWVNASGQRFTNESGFDKDILVDLMRQRPSSYWMVFDESARGKFGARGAAWLKNNTPVHPLLDNPAVAKQAQSLVELAELTGLPSEALVASVGRFNAMIDAGEDTEFGRFLSADTAPPKIDRAPFYAVQMFPMTRKNMGGVAIDRQSRVLDASGEVLPGLYAVGELNGSLGINGKYGLDGMFLGPAIISGRLAGQSIVAATDVSGERPEDRQASPSPQLTDLPLTLTADDLSAMLAEPRDGYWHFQVSHQLVLERAYDCAGCHSTQLPLSFVEDATRRHQQTAFCTTCH